jgi:molybdopterin-binding protein
MAMLALTAASSSATTMNLIELPNEGGIHLTLSARNHLQGTIEDVQIGDVLAHFTIRTAAGVIESVITRRSFEEMSLTKGDSVTAVVKATEVMIAKP